MSKITFTESSAPPATPSANKVVLYAKSDGKLYSKDDAGNEVALGGGVSLPLPLADGGLGADASGYSGVVLIEAGSAMNLKYNRTASVAPTASDDDTQGYSVGSLWLDTTADKGYVCLDASTGAAVWVEITGTGSGGIGGSTGATDNALLRADGTGGSTLQSSPVIVDDSGNLSGAPRVTTTDVRAATTAGLTIETSGGSDVLLLGAGGSPNGTFYGNLSMNTSHKIVDMADPTAAQDAATKAYVDGLTYITALALSKGGTGTDLSGTGGAGQVVKQPTLGGAFTVGALVDTEIPSLPASKITSGVFDEARGGTNQSSYATGDLLYASGANTLAKLGIGAAGQVLQVSGGVPAWGTFTASGGLKQVVTNEYAITATGYSTNSTSFVDVDAAHLKGNITTTGGNSTVIAFATFGASVPAASASEGFFDLVLGTTRAWSSTTVNGIITQLTGLRIMQHLNVVGVWTGVGAGVQTIKLQYRNSIGALVYVSRDSGGNFMSSTFTIVMLEF